MIKKVAVLQSSYIPWKGYFDIISGVDEFIIYDDVQYSKNGWRNRNIIKTKNGEQWMTIPIRHLSGGQKINEIEISNFNWAEKHWKTIVLAYKKAPFFREVADKLRPIYENKNNVMLSEINTLFLKKICQCLNIKTKISSSTEYDYKTEYKNQDRLISLLRAVKATDYLSGPAAKTYIDSSLFDQNGINVIWKKYGPYMEYEQLNSNGVFSDEISVIDLLFNVGLDKSYSFIISRENTVF